MGQGAGWVALSLTFVPQVHDKEASCSWTSGKPRGVG